MSLPPNAIKLHLIEHLVKSTASTQRIIDPRTGYQYEEDSKIFDLICPLCKHAQLAPEFENVDYRCPQCGWHYKVIGRMLAIWNPAILGVSVPALAPGEHPAENILAGGSGDAAAADAAREASTAAWNKNPEDWGKAVQATVPSNVDKSTGEE